MAASSGVSAQDTLNGVYGIIVPAWSSAGAGSQTFTNSTGTVTTTTDPTKGGKHANHE